MSRTRVFVGKLSATQFSTSSSLTHLNGDDEMVSSFIVAGCRQILRYYQVNSKIIAAMLLKKYYRCAMMIDVCMHVCMFVACTCVAASATWLRPPLEL